MKNDTISPAEFEILCRENDNVEVIDVRTPVEYRDAHLEVARNVPLDWLDASAIVRTRNGAREPIYVICQSGGRNRQACEKFRKAGFTNIVNVEGGMTACLKAGLSVVRGKRTISLERQVRIAAGSLVLLGILLAWLVHQAFVGLSAFVGAGLVISGITDTCGMGMILARMPWNHCDNEAAACGTTCSRGP